MGRKARLAICFLAIFYLAAFEVYGRNNPSFVENAYQGKDMILHILCGGMEDDLKTEAVTVFWGSERLEVEQIAYAGDASIPKTVYCLVDVSGSMEGKLGQAKKILHRIRKDLNEKDNIIIGKLGNQIVNSEKLTQQKEIKNQIDQLVCTQEDTNLYAGIVEAIQYLEQEPGIQPIRCLLVLSDGMDEQADGSTWEEAYYQVENSDIPVYTVAPMPKNPSLEDYEKAKSMGSFARASIGGQYYPRSSGGISISELPAPEKIGADILKSLEKTLDISVDLSKVQKPDKDVETLSVEYKAKDGQLWEDNRKIRVKDFQYGDNEKEKGTEAADRWLLFAIPVVLCAVAAAFFLAVRKRMQKKAPSPKPQRQPASQAAPPLIKLEVKLTAVGVKGKVHWIQLVKGHDCTVGRSEKAGIVLDRADRRLSGIHFTMRWDGGSVYIWDNSSSNGIAVNGVIVNELGKIAVKPGDLLRAGSYEYRMDWEE